MFFVHFLHAVMADVLAFELCHVIGIATENAGARRFILAKDDPVAVHINFQCIFFIDTQSAAEFDRNNNTPQLINLANNSC